MTRGTTICCSFFALFALSIAPKKLEPVALTPTRTVWTLALNNQLTLPPTYDESRAFFSIEENRLVAYDLVSGKQLWLVEARPVVRPAVGGDFVFVPEAASLAALRADDGSVAWRIPLDQPIAMPPVFNSGWLLCVAQNGVVFGFRASDGHLVWTHELAAAPHGTPVVGANHVYISATNGRVVALQVETGARLWERRVGGSPNEILALTDRVYVGSTDNFLYCLMVKDGRIDWRWRTGADVMGVPVADARRLYFVSLDNVLRSLNLKSGAQHWMRALPLRPTTGPVIAGGSIVVVGESRTIATFNLKDGSAGAELSAESEVAAPPRALTQPGDPQPMLLVVTRDIAKGATATLFARSIEPAVTPISPLPNLVTLGPTPAPRQ